MCARARRLPSEERRFALAAVAGGGLMAIGAFLPWLTLYAGLHPLRGVIGLNGRVLAAGGAVCLVAGVRGWGRRARRLRRLADRATPPHVSPAARESDGRAAFGARALHRGRGRAGRRGNGRTRSRAAPERLSYSYYSIDDAAEWVTVVEAPGRHPIGAPWVKDPAELTLCPTLPTSDRRGRKASQRCNSLRGCLWQTGPAGSNLQPPVLEASLPSLPKTRGLRNCPSKREIARPALRARPR